MKKVYILIAAFAGIVSLGACVDSNESASIEAIHKAKAEQLSAMAKLNNANAEAEKLLAEAEAANTKAQAEALKVKNELNRVDVELQKVALESDKVKLELKKAESDVTLEKNKATLETQKTLLEIKKKELEGQKVSLEERKQMIVNDLKRNAATLESELALLNLDIQKEANKIEKIMQDRADKDKKKVQDLLDAYDIAFDNWSGVLVRLEEYKADLKVIENELTSLDEVMNDYITAATLEQDGYRASIEMYKKYVNADRPAIVEKYNLAYLEYSTANREHMAAKSAYDNYSITEASNAYNSSDYYKAASFIGIDQDVWCGSAWQIIINQINKTAKITYEKIEGGVQYNQPYNVKGYFTVNKEKLDIYVAYMESRLAAPKANMAMKQKTYDDAVKAREDAKKAWEAAAEADKTAKQAEYEAAIIAVTTPARELETAKSDLKTIEDDVIKAKTAATLLLNAAEVTAFNKLVDAYNAAMKKGAELYVASQLALFKKNDTNAKYNALRNLLNSEIDGQFYIDDLEKKIANLQKKIDQVKKLSNEQIANGDWYYFDDESIETKEQAMAFLKELIADTEVELAAYQTLVDEAKAALNAAVEASTPKE